MDLRNIVSQPGEEIAWATFRTVQERSNVPTKHNPEPLVRLTATSRYSDEETSFDATKVTIAGIVRLAKYCRSSEWASISRFGGVQKAAFVWLNQADLDQDGYWPHYYNILSRKDTHLAKQFLLDITLLKWQDDVDGLVSRAYSQKRVDELSMPADLTPTPTRMAADAGEREAPQNPHGHWPHNCDCSADKQVVTQMRSDLEREIPDARAEISEMSGLTLAMLRQTGLEVVGVDRRSLFEVYTELWRAWEQSATFQAEVKSKRRLSVCISAELDLSNIGDIDFRIKVDRSRGLEVASKFRVPIHACIKSLDPPRDWPPEAGRIPSYGDVCEGLSVDSSRLEDKANIYFFFKIINVSAPLKLTVLEGQAVTVRDRHELIWIWIPACDLAASIEVPKGMQIEVINATIQKQVL
ncbi:hypothetical protein QC761_0087000 [Podospora bellae-mahoneyi]|uniref:Uncharacterized protein n=1 Tax=Podospora bellae-mahoneyi TaxID=2093777 RepID=A0ABR0FFB5_9PEZI|nr:hypothetical protein QC761_0087000 [Podospora bellae-mahoneyi]